MNDTTDSVSAAEVPLAETVPPHYNLRSRLTNLVGTPRRYFLNVLRADYVRRNIAMRKGECNRCGICCQLVVKCVFLRFDQGLAACARYENRPPNCSEFPISQADIDDINRIAPHAPCGYSFTPPCHSRKPAPPEPQR